MKPSKITDRDHLLQHLFSRGRREGDCLIWTGSKSARGYGRFQCRPLGLYTSYVHRFVCDMVYGMDEGQVAMHSCDRPACFEPSHLSAARQADNVHDSMAKGRHRKPPIGLRGKNVRSPSATTIRRREAKRRALAQSS